MFAESYSFRLVSFNAVSLVPLLLLPPSPSSLSSSSISSSYRIEFLFPHLASITTMTMSLLVAPHNILEKDNVNRNDRKEKENKQAIICALDAFDIARFSFPPHDIFHCCDKNVCSLLNGINNSHSLCFGILYTNDCVSVLIFDSGSVVCAYFFHDFFIFSIFFVPDKIHGIFFSSSFIFYIWIFLFIVIT